MILEGNFALPRPISRKIYRLRPQKLKLLIRNQTFAFTWYECRWPWQYFKVIRLFHIKFLVNGSLNGKRYYRILIGNHTLAFDWCHFWWPWSIFQPRLSFPCPFQQSLSCFRIAQSPSNSWASCSTFIICLEKRVCNVLKFTNVLPLTRTITCSCREPETAINHTGSPGVVCRATSTADIWKHGVRPQ